MEKITLMQEMVAAAGAMKRSNMLKDSMLKCPVKIETALESIRVKTDLATIEEAMVLVAIFDNHCADEEATLGDLSRYFKCSSTEIMVLYPAVKSLISKGYIRSKERNEREIRKMSFILCEDVFNSIAEGSKICPSLPDEMDEFDQFVFCMSVHEMAQERSNGKITTKEFFRRVERMEAEHGRLDLVKSLKSKVSDLGARVWFYEICRDYSEDFRAVATEINLTLKDFYDSIAEGVKVKVAMTNGTHPLFKAELVRLDGDDGDELALTDDGLSLLYGNEAEAFGENYRCSDRYDFIEKFSFFSDKLPYRRATANQIDNFYIDVRKLENKNGHLTFVANLRKLVDRIGDRVLFYAVCLELLENETMSMRSLGEVYYKTDEICAKRDLKCGRHILQKCELVQVREDSFLENSFIELTDKGRKLFLEEDVALFDKDAAHKDVIDSSKIVERHLYFEPELEKQLELLKKSLYKENLAAICGRLKSNGLPSGIAVLLYGLPGTGKTESAMQIARATGRPVMHVDISQTKSCWFGESEKRIREVFNSYRELCLSSRVTPILLFNEADAVFSKRKDSNSSNVAQTENAIQNIILEEMERLDGILIATTNLADNLDKAFERRFLFKIRFDKPTVESKTRIWKDRLPNLSDRDTMRLASEFDFSGGEIDNIARKVMMEEVIAGNAPTMEHLFDLCREEKIYSSSQGKKIGF